MNAPAPQTEVKVGDYVAVKAFKSVPAFKGRITYVGEAATGKAYFHIRDDITRTSWHRSRADFEKLEPSK